MPAHVTIDVDRCEGNIICQTNAPTVFEVRDDDLSHVLIEDIPTDARDAVERAVRLCPKQAITLLED
jgi:ferredoxin